MTPGEFLPLTLPTQRTVLWYKGTIQSVLPHPCPMLDISSKEPSLAPNLNNLLLPLIASSLIFFLTLTTSGHFLVCDLSPREILAL